MTSTLHSAENLGVNCPFCNAPTNGYDLEAGVQVTIPGAGPNGGPGTLLGAGDEVTGVPWGLGEVKAAPDFNRLTLQPCGHVFRGFQSGAILEKVHQVADERHDAKAEATLDRHADLLGAAEAAGHGAVAEKYRQAVRAGSGEQQGLLTALKALTAR